MSWRRGMIRLQKVNHGLQAGNHGLQKVNHGLQ
jgi:hypothetical protein